MSACILAYSKSGVICLPSTSGVRQGDPLPPLYFCLGIKSTCEKFQASFPELEIYSYLDDISIMFLTNSTIQFDEIINWFEDELSSINLTLNRNKCQILDPTINQNSINILRVPVGMCDLSEDFEQIVNQYMTKFPILFDLPKFQAFKLLRFCHNFVFNYLFRCGSFNTTSDASKWDSQIEYMIQKLSEIPQFSDLQLFLLHLRTKDGGIGFVA